MELSESHWKCYVQINTIHFLELSVHQDRYLMVICLNRIQQTPLNGSTDHVSADYVILLSRWTFEKHILTVCIISALRCHGLKQPAGVAHWEYSPGVICPPQRDFFLWTM